MLPVVLSARTIREELDKGRIIIDPRGDGCIQPSSVDLHVDHHFRLFRNHSIRVIDVREDLEDLTELVDISEGDSLILHPGEFVLGSTRERVSLPDDLVARLEGKSSLGRLGLLIHSTAGFVDAGWDGHLTLELSNVANLPITVYPGWLQALVRCTPLYQGVALLRGLDLGMFSWSLAGHVLYLATMGTIGLAVTTRRLARLLLP